MPRAEGHGAGRTLALGRKSSFRTTGGTCLLVHISMVDIGKLCSEVLKELTEVCCAGSVKARNILVHVRKSNSPLCFLLQPWFHGPPRLPSAHFSEAQFFSTV